MRIVLYTLLGLIVLTVAAVAGGLVWVQNTDLAPIAMRMVNDKTGLAVRAENLRLSLWPEVQISAGEVVVPAFSGSQPMFSTQSADVRLKWGSFPMLWRGMQLTELKLASPNVYLHKPTTGPANWQTVEAYNDQQEAIAEGEKPKVEGMDRLPIASFGIVDVSNLNLTYRDDTTSRTVVASGVNIKADGTDLNKAKLNINGSINEQTLNADANLSFTDLQRVPLTATLNAAGLRVALDGEVAKQSSYAGAVNVQTANLKQTLDGLLGKAPPQAPASAFSLTGDVNAGGEQLALKNFNAALGDLLKANGDVDIKLGDSPSASGTFNAQGSNLKQLAALAMGAQSAANLPSAPFKLSTTLSGDDEIQLKNLNAELIGLLNANGDVTIVPGTKAGEMPRVDGQLSMRGSNLKKLAEAFGNNANLPSQPFNAGASFKGKDTYTLSDLNAQLATLATVTGNLEITPKPALKVKGDVKMNGNNLATAAKAFGVEASLPQSAFSAGFTVGGDKRIELSSIDVTLPQLLEAKGLLSLAPQAPHDVKGQFTISRLNLNALGYCKPKTGGSNAETAPTTAPPASATPWSDEPLPLESLRKTTFDVTLKADNIACASFPAETMDIAAKNTATELNISRFKVGMGSAGAADIVANLTHASTPVLTLTLNGSKVAVHQLVRTLADKGVELPLDAQANLSSRGTTSRALASNLSGSVNFNAESGRIPYTKMLGNLSSVASLLQGKVPTQSNDRLESLVGRYSITNGLMTTQELSLKAGGLTMAGEGTVNLPAWLIDYKLTPQVNVGDDVSIPVLIKGPLGGPNIGPDKDFISKLTGRLTSEGLKGLLGTDKDDAKGIGGAVGDLIGGKVTSGTVNNLLEGLGAKKKADPAPTPTEESTTTPAEQPQQKPLQNLLNNMLQGQ